MENQETQQNTVKKETKICKHCQSEIAKKAKVCPNCRKKQGGIGKWIVIGIVVIFLLGSIGGESETDTTNTTNEEVAKGEEVSEATTKDTEATTENVSEKEPVKNEFVVGDVVETEYLKISFLSAEPYVSDNEFLQPAEGTEYYRIEFEFENIGDSDQMVGSYDFECYADGYAVNETWIGDDGLSATLSPGKKTKGAVYYEIPVGAKEICLEYETNFWTEDKIIFTIK